MYSVFKDPIVTRTCLSLDKALKIRDNYIKIPNPVIWQIQRYRDKKYFWLRGLVKLKKIKYPRKSRIDQKPHNPPPYLSFVLETYETWKQDKTKQKKHKIFLRK